MKGKLYLILTIILCVVSCQKDPECPIPEVGINISSENISANNIHITAELKYPTVLDNVECIFSENEDMSNSRDANVESSESGQYRILMDNLNPLTTYYYSFRFKSADTYSESEAYITKTRDYNNISFIELPSEEEFAWPVSPISAFVYWPGCETDGLDAEDYGFCISSTNQLPTLDDRVISLKDEDFSPETGYGWEGKINELAPATKYYIRAYAVNSKGLSYSSVTEFQTPTGEIYLSLSEPDALTITSAKFNAQVLKNDGNENLTKNVGFCWSTSPHPEFDSNEYVKSEMDYIGMYNINLTGLEVNQTYYIRAFGLNDLNEPYYSNEVTFSTRDGVISLTTEVLEVKQTTATISGAVIDDGGDVIIEQGFCWSKHPTPSIHDNLQMGSISELILESLDFKETYYVRSFATNSTGTYYGNLCEFTTKYSIGDLIICDDKTKGILFYIEDETGLIVSLEEFFGEWKDSNNQEYPRNQKNIPELPDDTIGDTNLVVGLGISYTDAIIAFYGTIETAASQCRNYGKEWYLPSLGELYELLDRANKAMAYNGPISAALEANGGIGLRGDWHWSSSEYDNGSAWVTSGGSTYAYGKVNNHERIRAIRVVTL